MRIQILAGTYGHNVNGRVRAVRAGDPPIDVPDTIGARLVKAGVAAELVDEVPEGAAVSGGYDVTTGEVIDADVEAEDEAQEDDAELVEFPAYNAEMTRAELEAIGAEVGLDPSELKQAKNKAAVIAMLDEAKAEFDAEDEAPDIDPAAAIL
nr:MAG TPA: hypothetical protein [Caudoviricetes sp.]